MTSLPCPKCIGSAPIFQRLSEPQALCSHHFDTSNRKNVPAALRNLGGQLCFYEKSPLLTEAPTFNYEPPHLMKTLLTFVGSMALASSVLGQGTITFRNADLPNFSGDGTYNAMITVGVQQRYPNGE